MARSPGCLSSAAARNNFTIVSAGTLVCRARPLPSLIFVPASQMPSLISRARTTLVASAIEPFLPAPIAACRNTTSAASLSLTISSRSTIRSSGIDETLAITVADAFARSDPVIVTAIPCRRSDAANTSVAWRDGLFTRGPGEPPLTRPSSTHSAEVGVT